MCRSIDPHYQRERFEVRCGRVRHREVKSLALRHMQPVRGLQGPSPGRLTTELAGVPAITPLLKTLPLASFCWWPPHSWTAEGGYQIWQLDLMWSHIFHVFYLCNPRLPKRTVSFWILTFTTYKPIRTEAQRRHTRNALWVEWNVQRITASENAVSAVCWETRASLLCCSN